MVFFPLKKSENPSQIFSGNQYPSLVSTENQNPPLNSSAIGIQRKEMASSSSSSTSSSSTSLSPSSAISPRKLRSDLYSYSHNQEEPSIPLVISVLASLIDRNLARNERIAKNCNWGSISRDSRTTVFDSHEAPDMTIQSYLERIFRYTRAGPSVYVVAYVYIDRLCEKYQEFRITSCNAHRLLITTIMVASKCVEDINYRNSYFARVGGLSSKELNKLEVDFLFLMGFKLHVNVSVFQSYCSHLEREVSIGGGYQIERALRCAEEIKLRQSLVQQRHDQIAL